MGCRMRTALTSLGGPSETAPTAARHSFSCAWKRDDTRLPGGSQLSWLPSPPIPKGILLLNYGDTNIYCN